MKMSFCYWGWRKHKYQNLTKKARLWEVSEREREVCTSPACGKHIKSSNPWATTATTLAHIHTRKRGEREGVCVWVNERKWEKEVRVEAETHTHTHLGRRKRVLSLSHTLLFADDSTQGAITTPIKRAGCTDPNSPPSSPRFMTSMTPIQTKPDPS